MLAFLIGLLLGIFLGLVIAAQIIRHNLEEANRQ